MSVRNSKVELDFDQGSIAPSAIAFILVIRHD